MSEPTDGGFIVQDEWAIIVATLAGMRQQLVDDGWTDEQAREIVAAAWTTSSKGGAAE